MTVRDAIRAQVERQLDEYQLGQEYTKDIMRYIETASPTITSHFGDDAEKWPGLVKVALTFIASMSVKAALEFMQRADKRGAT